MDLFIGILIGITWIAGMILMRSITTFFHEMGHALPALAFTKEEKVTVFIGTYGNLSNALQLNFGRLVLYLKLNVFNWRIGLCQHGATNDLTSQLIIILGGPIASLLISLGAFYYIVNNNLSQTWIIFISFFLLSSIIDFFVNMDPSHTPIKLHDNSVTYSDGYQFLNAIKRMGLPVPYFDAEKLLYDKKPAEAITICHKLIATESQKKPVYDLIIKSYIAQKDYYSALDAFQILKGTHKLSYLDFYQMGFLNLKLNRFDKAMDYFNHCAYQKHTDAVTLNSRAYINLQQGNYQKAKMDLDAAITYAPDFVDAWNNQGLLKIKTNDSEGGFEDIQYAKSIDDSLPAIYYNLGVYFEAKRDYSSALENYKKAEAMGIDHHGIGLKIAEMERNMETF